MVKLGRYSSGQRGQTVNLLSFDFAGSNPALPTKIFLRSRRKLIFEAIENKILVRGHPYGSSNLFDNPLNICNAGVAQLVERQPSKLNVAGSNPVSRSKLKVITPRGVISVLNKN